MASFTTLSPRETKYYIVNSSTVFSLGNGLLARSFATTSDGGWGTWDIQTLSHGSALRAISPEAIVSLDNTSYYIGGLVTVTPDDMPCPAPQGVGPTGSCPVAYLNRTQRYAVNQSAFQYVNHSTSLPEAPFPWKPGSRHSRTSINWPPKGIHLQVHFLAPLSAKPKHLGVTVTVHYELYDGHPIMAKWLTVNAPSEDAVVTKHDSEQGTLPPNQEGPVHISRCGSTSIGQEWSLLSSSINYNQKTLAFGSPIFLQNGTTATENRCLTSTDGTARHSFNDRSDVRPCQANTADPHQLWNLDATSKLLQCAVSHTTCCLDVNNHQKLSGTVTSISSCSSTWHWQLTNTTRSKQGLTGQIESVEAPGFCLTYHTEGPPPAPPPGPAPLPPDAIVITGMTVETLRLNGPWGATEPRPFDPTYGHGTYFDDSGPTLKTRIMSGFLINYNSQRHGTTTMWSDDPTFDPAYAGNIGADEPVLTVSYTAPNPSQVLTSTGSSTGTRDFASRSFTSFRSLQLYADTTEKERQGLMRRKLVRLLAPQTQEAPLFMHLTNVTPAGIQQMVDQIVLLKGRP